MAGMMNARRKLEFLLLFFMVLFAFAATDTWIAWATGVALLVMLMIVDFLFMDDSAFLYEPDLKNYQRKTAPKY